MNKREYTSENIQELKENEIFVFGSNNKGWHDSGAASIAVKSFGAVYGQAKGLQGQSYGIVTINYGETKELAEKASIFDIYEDVLDFNIFTKNNLQLKFYVTKIGCGIAGYLESEIAPIFILLDWQNNVILPESFDNRKYTMTK